MNSFITSIGTASPQYKISQPDAAVWMANVLNLDGKKKRLLYSLYESTGIGTRYSVLPDYSLAPEKFRFFPSTPDMEPFPGVQSRMKIYEKEALPLALKAIDNCLEKKSFDVQKITHLITVSCTGMYAPGLDIQIVENLGLPGHTQRMSIQFMGCYAAFNGLKAAHYICKAEPESNVLVICVELCTLHFQKSTERDDLVSNALFGDGAAAVLVQGMPAEEGVSLSLESFHCGLLTEGKKDMAWSISDTGFQMALSSYVPDLIKVNIKPLVLRLLEFMKVSMKDISYHAVHPGGKKILEAIESEFGLSKEDNSHAYKVLRDYGNMSSSTVLFVINSILETLRPEDNNKHMLSLAFGPGLTIESLLGKVVYN